MSGFDEESYITNLEILDPPEPANLSVVIGKEDEVAYQRLDVCAAGIRRWFKAGHFIAYSWREIAHKVRVVKV